MVPVGLGAGVDGCRKSCPQLDSAVHSELLYQLQYPALPDFLLMEYILFTLFENFDLQ